MIEIVHTSCIGYITLLLIIRISFMKEFSTWNSHEENHWFFKQSLTKKYKYSWVILSVLFFDDDDDDDSGYRPLRPNWSIGPLIFLVFNCLDPSLSWRDWCCSFLFFLYGHPTSFILHLLHLIWFLGHWCLSFTIYCVCPFEDIQRRSLV